jgi:hypothetical protein
LKVDRSRHELLVPYRQHASSKRSDTLDVILREEVVQRTRTDDAGSSCNDDAHAIVWQ